MIHEIQNSEQFPQMLASDVGVLATASRPDQNACSGFFPDLRSELSYLGDRLVSFRKLS